jgi:hypothetical protein
MGAQQRPTKLSGNDGVVLLAFALLGCHAPIVEGDGTTVKEAADTLAQSGIPYQIEVLADDRSRVEVLIDDVPRAHEALDAPRPLEALPSGEGLLGRLEDRERTAIRARERALEELLEAFPEVSRATVRLAIPTGMAALNGAPQSAKASVLLQERGAIDEATLRTMITHAEPELASDAIVIVQRVRPPPPNDLVVVGPFAVAPGSARQLRALVVALSGSLVVLLSGILVWYVRSFAHLFLRARTDSAPPSAPSSEENVR